MDKGKSRLKSAFQAGVCGAFAGVINGLFGGGGGLILISLFIRWLKIPEKKAFATCVAVILPLCAVSAAIYFIRGNLYLEKAAPYLAGGFLGGIIAGRSFKSVPVVFLRRALALLLVFCGLRALLWA